MAQDANEMSLKFEIDRFPSAAVLHISGSAGIAEAEVLREELEALAKGPSPVIVLDLSEMDFICSTALGAIISAHTKSRHLDGKIRLVNPQAQVRRVLELTRLTKLFEIFSSVEQAVKG